MRRALGLAFLLVLALSSSASASPHRPRVDVGRVVLSRVSPAAHGRATLLVPVSYPIAFAGRLVEIEVLVSGGDVEPRARSVQVRASGGLSQAPEHRRRFKFVHRVELGRMLTRQVRDGAKLIVKADGHLDVNGDGRDELASSDVATQALHPRQPGERRICSSVPQLRARPGQLVSVRLPTCSSRTLWTLTPAQSGKARIHDGRLVYRSAGKFRGTEEIMLIASPPAGAASSGHGPALTPAPVVVKVGTAQTAVVRALGDSVTAGFGYYDEGSSMPLEDLLECKPGATSYDDACSSNSAVRGNTAKAIEYAPDYGLANNVSWAAQWANDHGVSNYENLAVSGSEPSDWAPGGQLHTTTKRIEAEDPDYLLLTLGANPLLSNMLFGADEMGCAIYSDFFGGYSECIEEAFERVHLRANLKGVYTELVAKTSATIYLMQYHLAIPSTALAYSATQIAEMGKLLNREIASVAAEVGSSRLRVVTPPHFNVGVDISPVYPSKFSCSRLGYEVDGPSVQNDATQDELLAAHPLSFCAGPASGPPWVISGDTGIHPSAAGYTQMASRVPAPE
jgi:lysophospholipase L1-like esterase